MFTKLGDLILERKNFNVPYLKANKSYQFVCLSNRDNWDQTDFSVHSDPETRKGARDIKCMACCRSSPINYSTMADLRLGGGCGGAPGYDFETLYLYGLCNCEEQSV